MKLWPFMQLLWDVMESCNNPKHRNIGLRCDHLLGELAQVPGRGRPQAPQSPRMPWDLTKAWGWNGQDVVTCGYLWFGKLFSFLDPFEFDLEPQKISAGDNFTCQEWLGLSLVMGCFWHRCSCNDFCLLVLPLCQHSELEFDLSPSLHRKRAGPPLLSPHV